MERSSKKLERTQSFSKRLERTQSFSNEATVQRLPVIQHKRTRSNSQVATFYFDFLSNFTNIRKISCFIEISRKIVFDHGILSGHCPQMKISWPLFSTANVSETLKVKKFLLHDLLHFFFFFFSANQSVKLDRKSNRILTDGIKRCNCYCVFITFTQITKILLNIDWIIILC